MAHMLERKTSMGVSMTECREAAGLTLTELSVMSGVSLPTLCQWETGRQTPRLDGILLVCDVLGISVDAYIGRTEIPHAELSKKPKAEWHEFLCFARDPAHGDHTQTLMYLCSRCGRMQSVKTDSCACGADMRGGM